MIWKKKKEKDFLSVFKPLIKGSSHGPVTRGSALSSHISRNFMFWEMLHRWQDTCIKCSQIIVIKLMEHYNIMVRIGKNLTNHIVQLLSDASFLVIRSTLCNHLGDVIISAISPMMENSLLLYLKNSKLFHIWVYVILDNVYSLAVTQLAREA